MKRIIKETVGTTYLAEVKIKNQWLNDLRKSYPNLTLEQCFELAKIDPTYGGGDYAGSYLLWIVKEAYSLIDKGVSASINAFLASETTEEFSFVIDVFDSMKGSRNNIATQLLSRGFDINKYSFMELLSIVDQYERQHSRRATNKDYSIVFEDSDYKIYAVYNFHSGNQIGHYTKWCIVKDTSFQSDIEEYWNQGFEVYFVQRKHYTNIAKNTAGQIMFPNASSIWCIIIDSNNAVLEAVDENNDGLFYSSHRQDVDFFVDLIVRNK